VGRLSALAGVAVGLAYALAWLVWAARTPAERRLETALHSLTAALVLAPLPWEATLRFHAVTTWTAGGILLFFTAEIIGIPAAKSRFTGAGRDRGWSGHWLGHGGQQGSGHTGGPVL
jgi:hypothetical protein